MRSGIAGTDAPAYTRLAGRLRCTHAGRRTRVKYLHELRDPVHQFITVKSDERTVIDSRAVQRLRHVAQLAMTSLIYPAATHRRFEHSLGVMHLAGEVFDVLTRRENVSDAMREVVPELNDPDNLPYWRTVVRMGALCHDLGHLPFSHAAEHELLPAHMSHESLSEQLILSAEMKDIFKGMVPPVLPETVAKIAIGAKSSLPALTVWEALLSEIVTGDAFGVDRIDYLLRDSLHAGVAYGRFDHHRLIQTLRLLPPAPTGGSSGLQGDLLKSGVEPQIGVEHGGLHAAEALLLARYFMFKQLYFHAIRIAYDIHLIDFLKAWLPGGMYDFSDLEKHLAMTDNEVYVGIRSAADDGKHPAHDPARRILHRDHFKVLYERNSADIEVTEDPGYAIFKWAEQEYGVDSVRYRKPTKGAGAVEFPVQERGGSIASSFVVSTTIANLPASVTEFVFMDPAKLDEAAQRLKRGHEKILKEFGSIEYEEHAESADGAELSETRT